MNAELPDQHLPPIDHETALRHYQAGVRRLIGPSATRIHNSMINPFHYSGIRAAWDVLNAFPETDTIGSVDDPQLESLVRLRRHMKLGMVAISSSGRKPLSRKFTAAYEHITDLFAPVPQQPEI